MSRKPKPAPKIIWQSAIYPWMTFTENQLVIFRARYPRIPSWQNYLKDLEAYVASNEISNPDKVPTAKGWGNFLNNCARIRHKDIVSGYRKPDGSLSAGKHQTTQEYYTGGTGVSARPPGKSEPVSLADILSHPPPTQS